MALKNLLSWHFFVLSCCALYATAFLSWPTQPRQSSTRLRYYKSDESIDPTDVLGQFRQRLSSEPKPSTIGSSGNSADLPGTNDLWWDLFQQDTLALTSLEGIEPSTVTTEAQSSWLPNLGAWRAATTNIDLEDEDSERPPSLRSYLDGSALLLEPHVSRIAANYEAIVKRGSTRNISKTDAVRVQEAVRIAYLQLWGKTTARSLEDSIVRARGLAAILGELQAEVEVVIAGILHEPFDQIKDEDNADEIRTELVARFGKEAIFLCESYNRLPKFMARKAEYTVVQSENHIQMLVAFLRDYRTLYIRLADRLHTLRLLGTLPLDDIDRKKIAQEALSVYAPLAHKMGVMKVKGELEDLAFRFLNPEVFKATKNAQVAANKAYHQAADQIQELLSTDPYLRAQKAEYKLTYRIKDKYQLVMKMRRKGLLSVNEVHDALGLRIIVNTNPRADETSEQHVKRGEDICRYFVEKLRNLNGWEPTANGFKDYITETKENGYQSLHQYIRNRALGTNVEVQVRTKAMHIQAELGEAAHWFYKDNLYRREVADSKIYRIAWRSKEQMTAKSPAEMISMARMQLLSNRVFVFLNDKATVLNLKRGATALDAAFAIHTEIGLATSRVTIDGKPAKFSQPLKNGETISVETESPEKLDVPHASWFDYVTTSLARNVLRQHFKERERSSGVIVGTAQLLLSLTLNAPVIQKYTGGLTLDAYRINRLSQERLKMDVEQLLFSLGNTTTTTSATQEMMGALLGVPADLLATSSPAWCLTWARLQGKNGWDDKAMRQAVLLPLLRDILPSKGFATAEKRWLNFIGPLSLTDEKSVYSSKLSRLLRSQGKKEKASAAPVAPALPSPSIMARPSPPAQPHSRRRDSSFSVPSLQPNPIVHRRVSQRPFSLEASSLPPVALRIAKASYATMIMQKREKKAECVVEN